MLFRIDFERFITHAIDHFTTNELLSFKYAIIGTINNGGCVKNVSKLNDLFPLSAIQENYRLYKDKSLIKKMYFKQLDEIPEILYEAFVNNIIQRVNIVILCRSCENVYIDLLTEYLKKTYALDCIDLNKLFKDGRIGPIYIDRNEISDKATKAMKSFSKNLIKSMESTQEGREKLMEKMNTSQKIAKLKELGIKVGKSDKSSLDKLLVEAWIEDQ